MRTTIPGLWQAVDGTQGFMPAKQALYQLCEGYLCLICTLHIPMEMLPINFPLEQLGGLFGNVCPYGGACGPLVLGLQHKPQAESRSVFS